MLELTVIGFDRIGWHGVRRGAHADGIRSSSTDLLWAFAAERCRAEFDDAARAGAVTRLLDHYLSTTAQAMDYVYLEESKRRPSIAFRQAPSSLRGPH